jgi:hypothetical protein
MNRFSKDIGNVDNHLSLQMLELLIVCIIANIFINFKT